MRGEPNFSCSRFPAFGTYALLDRRFHQPFLNGPCGHLRARSAAQLEHDISDMRFHSAVADHQRLGDLTFGQPTKLGSGRTTGEQGLFLRQRAEGRLREVLA
jgi:hypothetical protein